MPLAAKNPKPIPVPPVRKGEPGTGVNAPLASTENAETLLRLRSLLVYTKVPCAIAPTAQVTIRRNNLMGLIVYSFCSVLIEKSGAGHSPPPLSVLADLGHGVYLAGGQKWSLWTNPR